MPSIKLPAPVMAFAIEPKAKGDEDKVFTALRRLQEEDPTIDLHRDAQTGEQIVAGLSQIHVEVIVDRMRSRFGAEVDLKPPRVPYQETIRGSAKAHGRHKKQTGGRGQFGDCHIEIEPLPDGEGFEFVNAIKGGVIPQGFIPAVEKGVLEAMQQGAIAGFPIKGVRVRLFDGSYHTVDSSEMAFKMAGSIAMKQALEQAEPVLLEPIMLVTASVPEESVGDVMGDLSSRRGRPLGTEGVGGMTEVKAEVPMAEIVSYAPDLRSITGGQGEYTLEFLRYEEVPAHLAQKVIDAARDEARSWPTDWAFAGLAGRGFEPRTRWRPSVRATLPLGSPGPNASYQGHPDQPDRRRLRHLRAHAAARRACRGIPRGRAAAAGLRAVHRPRAARGLDPRERGRRPELRHTRFDGRGRSFIDRLRTRRDRAREVNDEIVADESAPPVEPPARRASAAEIASASSRPSRSPRSRGARATSAPSRPTPTSRWSARWRSSTPPTTSARSAAWPARSAPPRCACAHSPSAPASSRSRSCGSSPGTATRSTSPTRREASAATPRATSCPSSTRPSARPTRPPTIAAGLHLAVAE